MVNYQETSVDMQNPEQPDVPQNLHKVHSETDHIKLGWDAVDRAVNYTVFRDDNKIKEGITDKSYRDYGLQPDTGYDYQVKAVNYEGESNRCDKVTLTTASEDDGNEGGGDSDDISFGLEVMSVDQTHVKLTWNQFNTIGSISIYRKSESQSSYDKIDEIDYNNTIYSDYSVKQDTWYEYKIKKDGQYSDVVTAYTDSSDIDPMMFQTSEIGPASKVIYSFNSLDYEGYVKYAIVRGIKFKCEDHVDSLDLYATLKGKGSNEFNSKYISVDNDYKGVSISMSAVDDSFFNPEDYEDWELEIDVKDKRGVGFKVQGDPQIEITTCLNPYHNSDQDDDGWIDSGFNRMAKLELTEIRRVETPDTRADEFYLTVDDGRRYPGYDGIWEIPCNYSWKTPETVYEIDTTIDKRVVTENNDDFFTELSLHHVLGGGSEGFRDWNLEWDISSDTYSRVFEPSDNLKYKLKFKSTLEYFADPDPTDSNTDSDGDGLTDAEEYEMSNDPDSWSVDGRAVPTRKDIFAEVDHMDGHEMGEGAKWRVGTRFLNNPTGEEIWLHLDDGLMGGGEEIEHEKYLTENREYFLYNDRGLYGNGDYGFEAPRHGKFHYCIIGHYNNDGHDVLGEALDDEFQVFDERCKKSSEPHLFQFAKTFMHELGHNLDLDHPEEDPDIPDNAETSMHQGFSDTIKFHTTEWEKVDLKYFK
ncbi:MAG: hypothetical protein ACLFU5_07250 [Thermoplasmata archaeon]